MVSHCLIFLNIFELLLEKRLKEYIHRNKEMQRLSSKETSCEVLVAYTGVGAEKGEMHKCRM